MNELIFLVLGVVFGGLISWYITHRYYLKASADQREELSRLKAELRPRTTLEDFDKRLVDSQWEKALIDHIETWVCSSDNTFQIRVGDRSGEFN